MTDHSSGPKRRSLLKGAVSASLFAGVMLGSARAQTARQGPNILFVFTDQERYHARWPKGLSLPGHERMERTGVTFTNHQCPATMCTSSRSIMLTGLQTADNGMYENLDVPWMQSLSFKHPTIGHMLRKAGYYTAYKGKWHLNDAMAMENHPNQIKALFESTMDKDYGFYDYTGTGDYIEGALGGYQYDAITAAQAMQWLKANGRPMADRKQPWYLAVNFVNPHDVMWVNTDLPRQPVQARDAKLAIAFPPEDSLYRQEWNNLPLQSTWQQPLDAPGRVAAHRIYHEANGYLTGLIPNDEWRVRKRQNYYFNAIRDVDQQIVQVLDQLDRLGLSDNTIVIFTSDHGELLGSHGGLSGKGTTAYSQQNHVPMIVVHPAFPGGQSCRETTSHIDLVPTIVAMTGKSTTPVADVMARMKGNDLTALLRQPVNPDFSRTRGGVLFCYSQLMVHDPGFTRFLYETLRDKAIAKADHLRAIELFPVDWSLRVAIRSITDERYRFTRYFPFRAYNTPTTLDDLRAKNDLELYDLRNDPDEVVNLAYDFDANRDLIARMNAKLNALIAAEIGVDDGSFLPFKDFVDWGKATSASVNL